MFGHPGGGRLAYRDQHERGRQRRAERDHRPRAVPEPDEQPPADRRADRGAEPEHELRAADVAALEPGRSRDRRVGERRRAADDLAERPDQRADDLSFVRLVRTLRAPRRRPGTWLMEDRASPVRTPAQMPGMGGLAAPLALPGCGLRTT